MGRAPAPTVYGYGPGRRFASPTSFPRKAPTVRWRFKTGRPIAGSAVVGKDGAIFLGSLDGTLYALEGNGTLRWKRAFGAPIFGTPALSSHCVLVGSDDESIRCYAPHDGKLRWRLNTGPCPRLAGYGMDRVRCQVDGSALWARDGSAYVAADALYALSAAGKLRWRIPLAAAHARSSVALADDLLLVGTQGIGVVALGLDGAPRWRMHLRYHCDGTPAVDGDRVYVGCDDGILRALKLSDGSVIWSFPTRGALRSGLAVDTAGHVIFGSHDGILRAVSRDGSLRWKVALGGAIHASPVVDPHGVVVVGARDGRLYGVDGKVGRILWSVPLGADVDSSVAIGKDGMLLVGSDDGHLYGMR